MSFLWCTSTGIALKCLNPPSFMTVTFSTGVIAGRCCRVPCLLESHPSLMYRKTEFALAKVFLKPRVKDELASSGERTLQHSLRLPGAMWAQPTPQNRQLPSAHCPLDEFLFRFSCWQVGVFDETLGCGPCWYSGQSQEGGNRSTSAVAVEVERRELKQQCRWGR